MIKFGSGIDLLIPKTVPGGALFTVLWGGLVFAGLDVFQSTQRMIHTAEDQTRAFDPVNDLLGLYLNPLLLFALIITSCDSYPVIHMLIILQDFPLPSK